MFLLTARTVDTVEDMILSDFLTSSRLQTYKHYSWFSKFLFSALLFTILLKILIAKRRKLGGLASHTSKGNPFRKVDSGRTTSGPCCKLVPSKADGALSISRSLFLQKQEKIFSESNVYYTRNVTPPAAPVCGASYSLFRKREEKRDHGITLRQ